MTESISRILGQPVNKPAEYQPLTEALTEDDLVNMIMGVQDGDLRKGLKALKKGQLKKIYGAITGQTPDCGADGAEGEEGDDEPANQIKKLAGKKAEKPEPKDDKKDKADDKKPADGDKKDDKK